MENVEKNNDAEKFIKLRSQMALANIKYRNTENGKKKILELRVKRKEKNKDDVEYHKKISQINKIKYQKKKQEKEEKIKQESLGEIQKKS